MRSRLAVLALVILAGLGVGSNSVGARGRDRLCRHGAQHHPVGSVRRFPDQPRSRRPGAHVRRPHAALRQRHESDLTTYFKSEAIGRPRHRRAGHGRDACRAPTSTIVRDKFNVPHVTAADGRGRHLGGGLAHRRRTAASCSSRPASTRASPRSTRRASARSAWSRRFRTSSRAPRLRRSSPSRRTRSWPRAPRASRCSRTSTPSSMASTTTSIPSPHRTRTGRETTSSL